MRALLTKQVQSQILLSALFVAALSFITLAASFAETPVQGHSAAVLVHE